MERKGMWCILSLIFVIASLMIYGLTVPVGANDDGVREFYVAPEVEGNGKGSDAANAAYFRDYNFWRQVQSSLLKGPVTVNFLPGKYIVGLSPKQGLPILGVIPNIFSVKNRDPLKLENMGHPEHKLILQGMHEDGTVFISDPEEPLQENKSFGLFFFTGKNTVIRNLHFTGEQYMGYATRFNGENLLIENCSWIDLPRVYYGASGTAYDSTHHVTFKDCVFKRVGLDSHAHMVYNAYGSTHIYFINCYFEDCAGDYVRFRDETDYGVVFGCTFKSTGTYVNSNMPFVSVPLFNDDDPEKANPNANYEYFGTHFLIAKNTFIYPDDQTPGTRRVFLFHHSGFDPPGRRHLLSIDDVKALLKGSVEERRAVLKENLGLECENIYFFGNEYVGWGSEPIVTYRCQPAYGSKSRGWQGEVAITDTLNVEPVVETAEEAVKFWSIRS